MRVFENGGTRFIDPVVVRQLPNPDNQVSDYYPDPHPGRYTFWCEHIAGNRRNELQD
jgi:hypothetical protein